MNGYIYSDVYTKQKINQTKLEWECVYMIKFNEMINRYNLKDIYKKFLRENKLEQKMDPYIDKFEMYLKNNKLIRGIKHIKEFRMKYKK